MELLAASFPLNTEDISLVHGQTAVIKLLDKSAGRTALPLTGVMVADLRQRTEGPSEPSKSV